MEAKAQLDAEMERQFKAIKKFLGLKTDSEVVRSIIKYYYDVQIKRQKHR